MWTQNRIGEFIKLDNDKYLVIQIDCYGDQFVALEGVIGQIHLKDLKKTKNVFIKEYGFEPEEGTAVIAHAKENKLLGYAESFESYTEVNAYLTGKGLPLLYMPKKIKDYGIWFHFEGFGYGKKISETEMKIVMPDQFSKDHYHIRVRNTEHYSDEQLVSDTYEYMEAFGKNPATDLEVETYEASTHGSSGMDHNHYHLKSEQEVLEVLKNTYGINIDKLLCT